MCLGILESVKGVQGLSILWITRCIVKDRDNNSHHVVSDSRLITVQIDVLFAEFVSVEVATIGYVAAILLVQIEEEEVDSVKFKFPGG